MSPPLGTLVASKEQSTCALHLDVISSRPQVAVVQLLSTCCMLDECIGCCWRFSQLHCCRYS
eukprot:15326-Eustigmatos_ZCMA.PRE.1